MAEKILVRKVEPNLWQWRFVTAHNQWLTDTFYTGDINLLAESVAGKNCWLLLDGRTVGTREVDVGVKDRKLLAKLVPFEIEETVVTPVNQVIIAYGPLVEGVVSLAYTHEAKTLELVEELEAIGAEVQVVTCDFLELEERDGWLFLVDDNNLYVSTAKQQGFKCELKTAEFFIESLCLQPLPNHLYLVADSPENLILLREWLPNAVELADDLTIYEQEGGVWDLIAPKLKPTLDFRSGNLARRLPFGEWWAYWKVPAIAASIAFALALGATWGELHHATVLNKQLFAERNDVFRQVVPEGSITDPVRQLQAKLQNQASTEPSNMVLLISKITPSIRSNPDLKMTAFRYTQNNRNLQLNIESKDFALLETLRKQLIEQGLNAEIKRSSVSGDIHLAQIIVTES
ncbi:MAG: type II secretion system protein GspL [Marinagarivorans sp.]|nr:type II secretion system protein GspL [Marinagarivorans sp.]